MLLGHVQQGSFKADGTDKILKLRSDLDWMYVYNYTNAGAAEAGSTFFYWQRGMNDGTGIRFYKAGAAHALSMQTLANPNGFTLIDTKSQKLGANIAISGVISNDNPPVVNANGHGLNNGDVVRIYNAPGAYQLGGGIEFQIGNRAQDSFELAYMPQIAEAANANNGGQIRKVYYDPIFYPRTRYITKVSQANQALITLSVDHNINIGEKVRFNVPDVYGMSQLNGKRATVVNTGEADADGVTNTIRVDLDTSGFTAFAFPNTNDVPFTGAQVVPFGLDTAEALDQNQSLLNDRSENQAYIGINLAGGADSPAGPAPGGGNDPDVMYWVAGKSFNVNNQ